MEAKRAFEGGRYSAVQQLCPRCPRHRGHPRRRPQPAPRPPALKVPLRPSGPTPRQGRPWAPSGLQPPPPTAARPPGRPHVSHGPGPPLLPTRRGASNLGHALPPLQPVRADPRPGPQLTTGDAGCWLRPGSEWARRRPGGATRRRRSRQRISRRGMTRPVRRSEMRRTEQHARGEARRREARRRSTGRREF